MARAALAAKAPEERRERIMLATATNFRIAFTQRRFNDYVRYYRAHIAQWLTERP
jgi:hypothetical protein